MVLAETLYYLSDRGLAELLEKLGKDKRVYLPAGEELEYHLEEAGSDGGREWQFTAVRSVEPLKAVLFPARQDTGGCFEAQSENGKEQQVVVGAKACDLASLRILDHVFLEGDFQDPDYKWRRDGLLIISGDCTDAKEVCFCTLFGAKPYPADGYDLNLSPVDGGYVVECGSDKGKKVIEEQGGLFGRVQEQQVKQREENRAALTKKVDEQIKAQGLTFGDKLGKLLQEKGGPDVDLWTKYAATCVECAGCNFICPTCHCFLLCDMEEQQGFKRFRNWDSCQYKNFARVAGGANQRPRRAQRLHTRFEKKFKFFPERIGQFACTGCGRCVEACLGKIDLREILKELAK